MRFHVKTSWGKFVGCLCRKDGENDAENRREPTMMTTEYTCMNMMDTIVMLYERQNVIHVNSINSFDLIRTELLFHCSFEPPTKS